MYRIVNSEGRQGRAWRTTYDSLTTAKLGLMISMGWEDVYLSDPYESGHGRAWSAYQDLADMRNDQDGAKAPRIEEVRHG